MDTEKEIRVGERGLDERGRTYLPPPGHYPRALKRCEWIHSFWGCDLSSCLSLVSEGIQLLIVERAEVKLESGQEGGRMHPVETHGALEQGQCKLPCLHPDDGYRDISDATPCAPKWHTYL